MKRTWIKNARIVNEGKIFHGSIVIENEVIAEVLAEETVPSQPCGETIDAKGYYLMPGVIDDHVHFRDPGLTHKADIHTESTAAAAGGVTSGSITIMPFSPSTNVMLEISWPRT